MKYLTIKLRRDVQKNFRQFFSVFLMALLSVLVFMGLQGTYAGLGNSVNKFIASSNLPDSWVYSSTGFSSSQIQEIQEIKGVQKLASRTELTVSSSFSSSTSSANYLTLDSQDKTDFTRVYTDSGRPFDPNDFGGVWLNKEYVNDNHLKIGQTITVKLNGKSIQLKLMGSIQSAERMYYTGTADFVAPNYKDYGYGLISPKTLAQKFSGRGQGLPNVLLLKDQATNLRTKIPDILGNSYAGYYDQLTLASVSTARGRADQIRNLAVLFSFIFILLAILAMYTTIRRLIENQSIDIATLKALGFSNRRINLHYASYGLTVGGAGALVGTLLSPLVSLVILQSQKIQFSLPNWTISYDFASLFVILLVIAICVFSAFLASRKASLGLPAEFLRGESLKKVKNSILEKFPSLWSRIKFKNRWAIRDSSSHKTRLLMGVIGVTGGMMLMFAGLGMPDSFNHFIDRTYTTDYTYAKKVTTYDYPLLKAQNLEQWLQVSEGTYSKDDGHNRLFMVFGPGNNIHLKTENNQAIADGGIYVTRGFAQRAHIQTGNRLKVFITGSSKSYEFIVKGILNSDINQGAYLTEKTFEKAGGSFYPQTLLASKNTNLPSASVSSTVTIAAQKENAKVFVKSFNGIFSLIIILAVLLVIVVLYNLGSLSFVERTRDYATLRVLGLQKKELQRITMVENVLTTLIGWLIGIPLGFWFLGAYAGTMSNIQFEYSQHISLQSIIIASIVVWAASLSTSFLIGRRIRNLDMTTALKALD